MTATVVNGQEVLADQPARSPLTRPDGEPVYFRQIRELLLADGTATYGCLHCDFTAASPASVRPHLLKHRTPPAAPPARRPTADLADLTLPALLDKLRDLNRIAADRDHWRGRAQKAERALAAMRRALAEPNR
jgi:hypothetical protein